MRRLLILFIACAALSTLPRAAAAQNPVLRPDTMLLADTMPQELPAPRAAFIRSLLVPGWGHAYLGENRRAIVYASIQTTSWFMLVKTLIRLGDISDRDAALTALARDSLATAMAQDTALARQLADPQRFETALLTYPGLEPARDLVGSRERQRQDWIVYTTFFTFASAVDAYVTAHLKDFPADITTSRSADGGFTIGVRLPAGARR
ncbi:MAG TPA: DUF5683 domain-containing protein [Longimicrobiales bacterium]|nr:DUF5683 domain-containing protein [Longimicrobiales bacterium]